MKKDISKAKNIHKNAALPRVPPSLAKTLLVTVLIGKLQFKISVNKILCKYYIKKKRKRNCINQYKVFMI